MYGFRSADRDASIALAAMRDFQGVSAVAVHALPKATVCIAGFYSAHLHVPSPASAEQLLSERSTCGQEAASPTSFELPGQPPHFLPHDHVSSILQTHRTLLSRGVVGYQEVSLDSPSKVAAYGHVFQGAVAYEQPRVRGLLRLRPGDNVAETLDCMARLQVYPH
jgi:hypothetical protein